jgi:hypothetical protein
MVTYSTASQQTLYLMRDNGRVIYSNEDITRDTINLYKPISELMPTFKRYVLDDGFRYVSVTLEDIRAWSQLTNNGNTDDLLALDRHLALLIVRLRHQSARLDERIIKRIMARATN